MPAGRIILKAVGGTLTLFAFDAGQGLSEHAAPFDAVVNVLQQPVGRSGLEPDSGRRRDSVELPSARPSLAGKYGALVPVPGEEPSVEWLPVVDDIRNFLSTPSIQALQILTQVQSFPKASRKGRCAPCNKVPSYRMSSAAVAGGGYFTVLTPS